MIETNEGASQYEHSLNHALEFFSKAGSQFTKKKSFYGKEESALSLFQKSFIVDEELSMRLLFWLRDCRGGAGNRSGFRECLKWVAEHKPEWVKANIELIPAHGRWDDIRCLFGTPVQSDASTMWAHALTQNDVLAAKWCDRKDSSVKHILGMQVADFRRFIAGIRKHHIVEHKMCSNQWEDIKYESVPSVAMARYTKAFTKHDEERFNRYKEALKSGKTTIHSGVLFPHDCVRTARYGDDNIANAQFDALPDFLETGERIIVIADTSGSMSSLVAGSIAAVEISQGLALYCSSRIPKENMFHKKFIAFESESEFKDWEGMTFAQAVSNRNIFDGACGSTRIDTALLLILKTAKMFKLREDQMPTTLLIVSDMQFHAGALTPMSVTPVEHCLEMYKIAGYKAPKIVYWNVDGYTGSPSTAGHKNVALVSGFSPSILKAIFSGRDFSPVAVMLRAIEKYKVRKP